VKGRIVEGVTELEETPDELNKRAILLPDQVTVRNETVSNETVHAVAVFLKPFIKLLV
jgi:hypothetical protein